MAIPVWIAAGRQPGKTLFLSAGIHGDEINAITVLQRFVDQLDLAQLAGQLLIVPVANVTGFHAQTRNGREDGRDLNRSFPGDPNGTLSERIAHFILAELVVAADWGVDLHDAGNGSVLLPHARVLDDRVLPFAAAFGTEIIMRATLPLGYEGLLTVEAHRQHRLPFFHVEVGGEPVLWPDLVRRGVVGLRNLLIYQGILPGKMVLPKVQFFLPGRDDLAVRSSMEGLLTRHVSLGQTVTTGQNLATIVNPLTQQRAVVRAQGCGIVLALNVRALVKTGDDVVGVIGFGTCEKRVLRPRLTTVSQELDRRGRRIIASAPGVIFRTGASQKN